MSEHVGVGRQSVAARHAKARASVAPTVAADHVFEVPAKLIKTPADMKIWEKSEAYFEYLGFIFAINDAVKGKTNSQGSENPSETAIKLVGVLDKLDALIDETAPVQQPQRFGNVAFRTWYQLMRNDSLNLLQAVFKPEHFKGIPEVVTYLIDCFGNSTRIDYGTGHEISFVMFLCCLFKIGVFKDFDKVATGCYIFPRYLDLVRKLQKTYRMEPAGSHGVWSLDDYQFVPFIWGSSQLFGHPIIEPPGFLNQQILNDYGEDFMFLTCIQYINSVKTGPFAEHSNQLWSISGVSSWTKINGGLIKMYKAEVLSKFPVVQHIVFGSLFTLKPLEQGAGVMTPRLSMAPPPVPSLPSSISSKPSTRSSENTEKSSSGSQSQPSEPSKASSRTSDASGKESVGSEKSQASTNSQEEGSYEKSSGSVEAGDLASEERLPPMEPRSTSGSRQLSETKGSSSVRFSTGEADEDTVSRKTATSFTIPENN